MADMLVNQKNASLLEHMIQKELSKRKGHQPPIKHNTNHLRSFIKNPVNKNNSNWRSQVKMAKNFTGKKIIIIHSSAPKCRSSIWTK